VIFLTTQARDEQIARALETRAKGILKKADSLSALSTAIRSAAAGWVACGSFWN
jgi:DNA-binding NarL/FixJ family response regulator